MKRTAYVVAVSQKEADKCVLAIGWDTRAEAEAHLKDVQSPPTDWFYAQLYRVYVVKYEAEPELHHTGACGDVCSQCGLDDES